MTPKGIADSLRQRLGMTEDTFLRVFKRLPGSLTALPLRIERGWAIYWKLRLTALSQAKHHAVSEAQLAGALHLELAGVLGWYLGTSYPVDGHCQVIDRLCKTAGVSGPTLTAVLEAMPTETELKVLEAAQAAQAAPLLPEPPWPTPTELSAESFLSQLLALVRHGGETGTNQLRQVEDLILQTGETLETLQKTVATQANELRELKARPVAQQGLKPEDLPRHLTPLRQQVTAIETGLGHCDETVIAHGRTLADINKRLDALQHLAELSAEAPPSPDVAFATLQTNLAEMRALLTQTRALSEEAQTPLVHPASLEKTVREAVQAYLHTHLAATVLTEVGELDTEAIWAALRTETGRAVIGEALTAPTIGRKKKDV